MENPFAVLLFAFANLFNVFLFFSIEVRSRLNSNVTQLSLPVCSSSANHYITEAADYNLDNTVANTATLPHYDDGKSKENSSNSSSIHGIDNQDFNDCDDNITVKSVQSNDDVESEEFDLSSPEIADINISLTVLHDTIDAVVQRLSDHDDLESTVDSLHNGGNWSTKGSFRSAVSVDDDTIDAIFADALSDDDETCCSVSSSSSMASSISK